MSVIINPRKVGNQQRGVTASSLQQKQVRLSSSLIGNFSLATSDSGLSSEAEPALIYAGVGFFRELTCKQANAVTRKDYGRRTPGLDPYPL